MREVACASSLTGADDVGTGGLPRPLVSEQPMPRQLRHGITPDVVDLDLNVLCRRYQTVNPSASALRPLVCSCGRAALRVSPGIFLSVASAEIEIIGDAVARGGS